MPANFFIANSLCYEDKTIPDTGNETNAGLRSIAVYKLTIMCMQVIFIFLLV